jgi:hypothetical protein
MAKIEQTGRGKSVESKLDGEPESNHFAILQELVRSDSPLRLERPRQQAFYRIVDRGRTPQDVRDRI